MILILSLLLYVSRISVSERVFNLASAACISSSHCNSDLSSFTFLSTISSIVTLNSLRIVSMIVGIRLVIDLWILCSIDFTTAGSSEISFTGLSTAHPLFIPLLSGICWWITGRVFVCTSRQEGVFPWNFKVRRTSWFSLLINGHCQSSLSVATASFTDTLGSLPSKALSWFMFLSNKSMFRAVEILVYHRKKFIYKSTSFKTKIYLLPWFWEENRQLERTKNKVYICYQQRQMNGWG